MIWRQREDLENIVARKIDILYLERRYVALENEIASALLRRLEGRRPQIPQLVIADEIEQHRRSD